MYVRVLDLSKILQHKSIFLLGPRQTGKSTLLRTRFPHVRYVNLLAADTFRELSARPELLRQSLTDADRLIIVDEIQKLPSLLDEVHLLIERNPQLRFILTGSSARKLRRGNANLLAGRALFFRLHALVSVEVEHQKLQQRLNVGSLPSIIDSSFANEDLKAYVGTYLQEEIQAEALARNVESFSRFMNVAAFCNGQQINFTKVASDCGLSPRTVREYFQILTDTLIGFELPPYRKTVKRKPVATAKFYWFDVGVANTLLKRGPVQEGSESYGNALEHLIVLELRSFLDYRRYDHELTYWRSTSQFEVDIVIGDALAIEIKAKSRVHPRDIKGLLALREEIPFKRSIVVCNESMYRRDDSGVDIFPVELFLRKLWDGEIVEPLFM